MGKLEEILAKNVHIRRKSLKLSQKKLASLAGVSEHTILRLEKQTQETKRENLVAIAQVLGCSPEDLYKDADAIETKWATMTQKQMAQVMLSQAEEIDSLKARLDEALNHPLIAAWEAATPQERLVVMDLLGMIENPSPPKVPQEALVNQNKKKNPA